MALGAMWIIASSGSSWSRSNPSDGLGVGFGCGVSLLTVDMSALRPGNDLVGVRSGMKDRWLVKQVAVVVKPEVSAMSDVNIDTSDKTPLMLLFFL